MIIAKLIGGLGNQLFQYAVGRSLSNRYSTELKLDISSFNEYKLHQYSLMEFDVIKNYASQDEIAGALVYNEKQFHYDENFSKYPDNIYLVGYWQTEKYFNHIDDILKKEISVSSNICGKDKEIASLILSSESVCLHIRRGDYVKGSYSDQIFDACDLLYYKNAIEEVSAIIHDPHIFVFSDDHMWVKDNLKLKYKTIFVTHNDASTNYQDLRLMSLCKHNIVANSTFSWWGAWLNDNPAKIVYAPKKWFNSNVRNLDPKDIIPETWIKL